MTTATGYRYSNLTPYANCPLQFRYQEELHLVNIETLPHHMEFGAAMHAGLRDWYKGLGVDAMKKAFLERYPRQLDDNDLAKTRDNGAWALACYAEEYASDFDRYEILENEQGAILEDGFGVTLDMVVKDVETDQIYGVDHKTTGAYLNFDFWTKFEPNSQITQYIKYINEKYGWCDGFIINAIALRHRQKKSKDGPAGPWVRFERQIFQRTEAQIEQDTASRDDWIKDIERARETGVWRMNTSACRFCSYRPICSQGWTWEDDAELILNKYRQVCGIRLQSGEHCTYDLGHEGDCEYRFPEPIGEISFNVEV